MSALRKFWVFGLLGALLAPAPVFAATGFILDLGLHSDNLEQRFSAPTGMGGQVSRFSAFIRARPSFPLSASVFFEPSLAVLLPWRGGEDGFAKTLTSWLGLDLAIGVSRLKWRLGTGLQWSLMLSQGSAVDLNNATSTTTFYIPGGSSSAFQFLVETGFEFKITQAFSVGTEFWFTEVMSRQRRRVHGAFYVGVLL